MLSNSVFVESPPLLPSRGPYYSLLDRLEKPIRDDQDNLSDLRTSLGRSDFSKPISQTGVEVEAGRKQAFGPV